MGQPVRIGLLSLLPVPISLLVAELLKHISELLIDRCRIPRLMWHLSESGRPKASLTRTSGITVSGIPDTFTPR
ncbi:MAG: hypothetical protein ABSB94_00495 [Syntrophorhabdales bacterium]